jgi:hypothetical protein
MAMTGYYKTLIRPRTHRPLSMLKYDPVGTSIHMSLNTPLHTIGLGRVTATGSASWQEERMKSEGSGGGRGAIREEERTKADETINSAQESSLPGAETW